MHALVENSVEMCRVIFAVFYGVRVKGIPVNLRCMHIGRSSFEYCCTVLENLNL